MTAKAFGIKNLIFAVNFLESQSNLEFYF